MTYEHTKSGLTDEDRRDFLKVLGVTGAAAAGGVTLSEVREGVSTEAVSELSPIGESIRAELGGALDAEVVTTHQEQFVDRAVTIPAIEEKGLPENGPRDDFAAIADAGWPVYDHLEVTEFFETTTRLLPEFTPEYLATSAEAFVSRESLAAPLAALEFSETAMVDLVGDVVDNRHRISEHHWIATDEIPRSQLEMGEHTPAMTKAATVGGLLWLDALDEHLWKMKVLIDDGILADAVWDVHAIAAGFNLVTEGARSVAAESGTYSDGELAALLSQGFALLSIGQYQLVDEAFWITEEMRAPRRTDLRTITR